MKDFHIDGTKMARNGCKMVIYQMQISMINLQFSQDLARLQGTFCGVPFEPIKILTHYAHQNDRLSLSLVKYLNTVGKEWPEKVLQQPFINSLSFPNSLYLFSAILIILVGGWG